MSDLDTRLAVPRLHRSLAARVRGGCDNVENGSGDFAISIMLRPLGNAQGRVLSFGNGEDPALSVSEAGASYLSRTDVILELQRFPG